MYSNSQRLRVLWCLAFVPEYGIQHGANLRYVNLSRSLSAEGHRVYMMTVRRAFSARRVTAFLEQLKNDGIIAGYRLVDPYPRPRWLGRLSSLCVYPRASDWLLASRRRRLEEEVLTYASECSIGGVILSDRYMLPLLTELTRRYSTVVDWCDSVVLSALRGIRVAIGRGDWKDVLQLSKEAWNGFRDECLRERVADINLYVSPVDKALADKWCRRRPNNNRVLFNGVHAEKNLIVPEKHRNQLIFTGAMHYPPNHEAACWFIDRVFPLVQARVPGVRLVIAGHDPKPSLMARATSGIEVLGYVEDLRDCIARSSLYVAPMISGSGLKNKVLEALAAGTYLVATPMGVEFLPAEIRDCLLVSSVPHEMANQIVYYLANPNIFEERFRRAREMMIRDFTWAAAAHTLAEWLKRDR